MIATISKDFEFSASHVLSDLPPDHPCSRMHGHNYVIRVQLTGEVQSPGFVIDYRRLSIFKQYIDNVLDHRHLNDVLPGNPTAEYMAALFVIEIKDLLRAYDNITGFAVSVSETPKTWATVTA